VTFEAPRNAFFTLSLPQYGSSGDLLRNLILPQDIMELSVSEEILSQNVTGSLMLNDPSMMYSRVLRAYTNIKLSWGYKANGAPVESLFGAGTADVFTQNLERRGINAIVLNPTGSASAEGSTTFSCGFMSAGWVQAQKFRTFEAGSKKDVVTMILAEMKVGTPFISFDAMGDQYTAESVERQGETDFQFLNRLAYEWRCIFRMGFGQDGTLYAIFCDYKSLALAQPTINSAVKCLWATTSFSWRSGDAGDILVISYDWKNEEGENGSGDNVRIFYDASGAMQVMRFAMPTDTVAAQSFRDDLVKKFIAEGNDPTSIVLHVEDFNDPSIQQFWTPVKQETAPNGLGYSVNLHLLGNPVLTAGMVVFFNKGFPPVLTRNGKGPIQFYVRRATHTISQAGYFTDLEVVDAPTITPTGIT
jgi:hypothetical protein